MAEQKTIKKPLRKPPGKLTETPTKGALRSQFRRRRQDFVGDHNGSAPKQIEALLAQNLTRFLASRVGVWGAYVGKGDEASPAQAVREAGHIRWAYPCVEGDFINFYEPKNAQDMQMNSWQIWEPVPAKSRAVQVQELSGLLIPGIVFDRRGYRLGWGRGYYDRYLEKAKPCTVGVAFSVQISETSLPTDDHDVAVDWLITETEIYEVNRDL